MNHAAKTISTVTLRLTSGERAKFFTLLQSGVRLPSFVGESLGVFLNKLPGFSNEYITDRIQTIFLNGLPLDDLETVFEDATPVLALSAAMPGLAGAIYRRNSLHAALRGKTSQSGDTAQHSKKDIFVTLKLFNNIAQEKGQDLFSLGVRLQGPLLLDFLQPRQTLLQEPDTITISGQKQTREQLFAHLSHPSDILLTIVTPDAE